MNTRRLFARNRDYFAWFIGDTSAVIGSQLTSLAFTLLAYAVTRDLIQAGLIGSINAAARFVAIIPGGTIVDRFPKKTLMKLYAVLKIATMIGLCTLIATGMINFSWLAVVAVVSGLLSGAFGGLTNAILPFIVDDDDLPHALVANQSRDSIVSIGSAPIGGALFGFAPTLPFLTDALSYLALFWSATHIEAEVNAPARGREKFWASLFAGMRWVGSRVDIALVLLVLTVSNIGNFLVISSVELQIQKDGHPGWILGLVISCFSIGMIVGGLSAHRIQRTLTPWAIIVVTFATQVGAYAVLSLTTRWYLIAGVLFVVTLPLITMNSALGAYQMQQTPDHLQGRVGTVFMFVIGIGPALTGALAGALLSAYGWRTAILVAMSFCALALIITLCTRHMRHITIQSSPRSSE